MFARFDENPAKTLQDIKETKRYGQTDGHTHGQRENSIPTTNKVCGGYNHIKDITETRFTTLIDCKLPNTSYFDPGNQWDTNINIHSIMETEVYKLWYINPLPASHDFCCLLSFLLIFLGSLYCKQYGPRSDCSQGFLVFVSMIKSGLHLNVCSRSKNQMFLGQKINTGRIKVIYINFKIASKKRI